MESVEGEAGGSCCLQPETKELKPRVEELKMEEIKYLWSQLDGAQTGWQELSEIKEQLLVQTSCMEEMECLKKDYQIKWDKKRIEHENELEQLRLYFEQKLKTVEENYREELTMLHQRLQEVKDSFLPEMENSQDQHVEFGPSIPLLEDMTEKERYGLFEQLTLQLEHYKEELCSLQLHLDKKHKEEIESLKSSLKLHYQESLVKMKMDLSEKYISEIEELKRKHCLNLEELRAQISEEHLKEIAKLGLQNAQDAARQIETKVAERLLALEDECKTKHHVQAEMQLVSMQEEIEKLKRENADLKKMSVRQEMHLKQEFEQTEDKTKSLRDEMEDASGELKNLRREEKENRGGQIPIAVLRTDIELCINEKEKFLESYQQILKLLLKMVKAIKDTNDLIYKKTGNYSLASEDSRENLFMIGELVLGEKSTTEGTWHTQKSDRVGQGKFLNQTLPEHNFASLMADEISELSEHLCESIFENQDLVLENEEQIHKICHGLHAVVEKLLDQLAESTKQLEEMHTVSIHIEEDFKGRRWQVCQIVNDPHEPMDCFNEENKVNSQLVLELHKTKGFMEGCLAERYALEEALKLKEESEFRLVIELEALKAQIQELTQELARSAEEQKLLTNQNKALAASIGEREADLVKKIEHLAKAKLEVECQTEKDRSTLNAHVKMLEMELEEELKKNQNLAVMSLEVTDLKQQMQALERKLKNQRDFMDKQAAERERERDEFQEEIQKLEMELKLTAKRQASEHSKADLVESLQNEIKERAEDYNRLFLDRERIQKELVVQNEEIEKLERQIRELECRNEEQKNNINKLSQEMKEMEAELKQENIEKLAMQCQNPGESELVILQFLKSLVEEKNQETDHPNEQIMRLEYTIENMEGNEILENKVLEIQDTKSIIEHLHGDKEQLLRDKTQEVKQLNRVTEKLQKELVLLATMCQKADDRQDTVNSCSVVQPEDNFLNETKKGSLVNRGEENCTSLNPNKKQFQDHLEIAMAGKEALQQLLEEDNNLFKTQVKILEQNLQNVQQSSTEHFTKLTTLQLQYEDLQEEHKLLKSCLTYTQTELRICSAHIRELEDRLQDRQAVLSEKELQLQRVLEQKAVEVQHVKENVELENELYILTQTLHEKEAFYQRQISELQLSIGELKLQIEKKVEELEALRSERDLFYSHLKSYIKTPQDINQKETKLHKVGLKHDTLVHFEEKYEGKEERKAINIPSISAVPSYGDKLVKNTITHLKMSSKNHNIQDKHLQSKLCIQEEKITEEQQNLQLVCQEMWQLNQLSQNTQFIQKMSDKIQNIIIDGTAWDSPEILRKENSMELWSNLAVTPFSEVDSMHSIDSESLCSEHPVVPSDILGSVEWPASYCNGNEETAASFIFQSSTTPGPTFSVSYYSDVQENISVRNAEDVTLMPLTMQDDLRTNLSKYEGGSIEYVSSESMDASSDLGHQLHQENKETTLLQDDSVMAYLQCLGMVPDISETAMKEKEMFSQQLKHVLDMVYEESHKILVLSEKSQTPDGDKKNIQKTLSIEAWQRERLILLDSVQSLKDYFSKVPHEEDKENVSAFFDWSGELLQVIQCVLEMQQNMCQSYLQSHSHSPGSGDKGLLVEKLQHIIEQQEQQQKIILEHLLSSDRKVLLTKIKDLEAQLRLLYLQSQEKLQQLQEMLINTENHGNKQEHQLRRQVELLEYKLQQEKSIASDLQASLKIEQVKASQMHDLLKQEGAAIFNLKSDLCESKQANEQLQKSLQELQKEIVKYSSVLENKEMAMIAILQDLENEKCKEKELQNMLDEQIHQHKRREDEKSKAIEELQAALELQCIQNNQFSVALEHEQSANSNLRKELQIEHSRCEALLSQEQNKLLELQKNIELEKKRNLELLSALNHERVLTEQLSMRINECSSCKHKDSLQELQVQLYRERSHARELLATIEKTQKQVLGSKKMGEIQMYSEEPQKNQELHVTMGLQNKEQEIQHALEMQRKKEAQMKKECGQLQLDLRLLRDQENRTEQTVRDGRHKQHTFSKLNEMQDAQESQWKCNTGRIKALQQMVRDLKEQRKYFSDHRNQHKPPSSNKYANICSATDTIELHEEQKKLQNIREQLISVAAYLSEFVYKTVDKTINWPASSDETIATLLNILELEAELSTSFKPVGEKPDLQNCIKATEYEATKHNLVMENKSVMASSNLKMQKLYRKYLRAESFRKALVYQKKYLLLLLGGFQECEQATLSLIARMGIYPSPPDLNVSESRGYFFIKFRSAVRVIIAISRLKFLVKKWHKVSKKGLASESISPSTGHSSYLRTRVEALKQPLPIDASQEAGCCNINGFMGLTNCSPQSSHFFHDRSTSSAFQVSSKDPEQSLTDYVARLETIQQRLGILMLGQAPQQESL
uniref:Pericentrin isoform X1 n=2 Tax=Pogona vitticeps TaxID=103695 RepID=A0ABM5EIB3_9SAUR